MSLPASYFDQMYAEAEDPWGFGSRWYEQRKYSLTLAALPRERFRRGFEPGCSIGILTEHLADRCDSLFATDVASAAVEATARRVAGRSHVVVEQFGVPREWPAGQFDLIMISEIGYYLSVEDLGVLVWQACQSLAEDGVIVAVHWRHQVEDYPLTGDEVHEAFEADDGLTTLVHHVEPDFLLDVFARAGTPSIAEASGLL